MEGEKKKRIETREERNQGVSLEKVEGEKRAEQKRGTNKKEEMMEERDNMICFPKKIENMFFSKTQRQNRLCVYASKMKNIHFLEKSKSKI